MECDDLTAQERAAIVAWRLANGDRLTTQEIMDLTGLKRRSAWGLVSSISRVIPIYCDDEGQWCKINGIDAM